MVVSVGGLWLCSGRLDEKKTFFLLASGVPGLVFLSLASYLILGTVLKSARQQPEFGLSGLACHAKSKSAGLFLSRAFRPPVWRQEERPSTLARGRSDMGGCSFFLNKFCAPSWCAQYAVQQLIFRIFRIFVRVEYGPRYSSFWPVVADNAKGGQNNGRSVFSPAPR